MPVKMDDRIKCVKVDDETFELRFSKALAEDNGNWAVIARNDAGEGSQFFAFSAQMLPRYNSEKKQVMPWQVVPGPLSKLHDDRTFYPTPD